MNQIYRHTIKRVQEGNVQKQGFQAKQRSNRRLITEMGKKDFRNSSKQWQLNQKRELTIT
jgi:hypothetical protein